MVCLRGVAAGQLPQPAPFAKLRVADFGMRSRGGEANHEKRLPDSERKPALHPQPATRNYIDTRAFDCTSSRLHSAAIGSMMHPSAQQASRLEAPFVFRFRRHTGAFGLAFGYWLLARRVSEETSQPLFDN